MMKKYSNSKSLRTSLLFPYVLFTKIIASPKNCILFLLIFLGYNNVYSQSPSTFTTSGTWICPRGVTLIQVEAIGAGAGGRTANNTKGHVGGGGGGGAYSKRVGVTVVPGTSYTITVGTSAANTNGTSSTASFGIVTITAAGGSVGAGSGTGTIAGGAGGTVLASLGDVGSVFAGGAGGSGLGDGTAAGAGAGGGGGSGAGSAIVGNAGGNALTTATGGIAGGTVASYGGAGGAGGNNGAVGANASATNYGGGGGGGGEKAAGGIGRTGVIIITFNCPTETAAAGSDQSICLSTTTLAGNGPTSAGLTGLWTVVSGTATITTPTSPTSGVTGLVAGASAILRWTIDNGRCGSTSDDVIINNTMPAAIGGGALSVCTGANTVAFTNATSGGTWSITNGTGSATITAGGIATGVTAGTVDVVYTLGTCSVLKALTINQTPPAIGGGAVSVCTGATTPAFTNATGGGTWSITNGTGTATISAGGVVTGSTAGTVTVVYTVGSCSASTSLTVNTTPAAIGGGALSVCTGANTVAFTNATVGGTWSITNGSGTASISAGGIATGVTAGTVTVVYTLGTCSVTKALTVNQTPTTIGGGATTVCVGASTVAFTNANSGGTWSITNGTGSATISTGGVVTGVTAGTVSVVYTIGTCTPATVALTVNTIPSASITPSPTNGATGVCYAGTSPITSVSWAATATATSYDVYFGAGALPVPVTANVTTNSYTCGTLLASTTYSWKVVAKNACGDAVGSTTWTFTTAGTPCAVYCTPTASSGMDGTGITNVSYSSVNNTTSNTTVYNDYTSLVGNVVQGAAMPISVTTATGTKRYNIKIWVDWNNDGDFLDTGEEMFSGTVKSNTINGVLNIPLAATLGNHRMRVGITQGQGASSETATPCFTGIKGAFEDYTLNITGAAGCTVAPTVSSSPSSVSIANGGNTTFTATFGNSPTSYIWEVSSDGGTNFTTITNGGVYSTATTATLTVTGVTSGMNGFIYRVSASNACGTSAYSTLATLTVTVTYCSPTSTSSSHYISSVSSEGNLNDVSSGITGYSIGGYGNFSSTTIARQIPGGGININIELTGASGQFVRCYVDWNGDGVYADPSEQVYSSGTTAFTSTSFGFVVPVSQAQGNYRIRIRSRAFTDSSTIAPCTAGYLTGETEDYTIAIVPDCAALIQSVTNGSVCGANNPVTISAVGLGGTTKYRWYTTITGGTWEAETATGTYNPTLSATKIYYVTAFNGSCESLVRTRVVAKVIPTANISFTPTSPVVCGEDTVLTITAASDTVEEDIFYETFENATIGLTASTGTPYTNAGADSPWSVKTSTYQPTTTAVWRPAINSGSIDNNFGFTSSDYNGANIVTRYTTSTSYSTNNFLDLSLSFNMFFSSYSNIASENFKVQISLDNSTWADLATYTSDQGSASKFKSELLTIPNTYLNKGTIWLRFQYTSGGWKDGFAIDEIRFYGTKQLNTSFSWSSATPVSGYTNLACTINYTNQLVSTIYLKPTLTQMEATSFPITVTATLANGCPISQVMTVANNSRVWKGIDVVDATNWNDVDNWKPAAIPTIDNCVIIPNTSIVKGTAYQAFAKNLVVKSTGNLNVEPGNSITVKEWVNVDDAAGGIFELENTASLIQVDNVASNINTGKIKYKRNANLRRYDYVYLSSPVESQVVSGITQAPLVSGPVYKWNPTIANPNGGEGNWEYAYGDTMVLGKGYTVRSPDSFPLTYTTYYGLFKGVPNNGIITIPVSRGTLSIIPPYLGNNGTEINSYSDNWNLIGNPYPSSIRGSQFLFDNRTKIEGNLRIWTHQTLPNATQAQPFYGSFGYNYTPNDYLSYNFTGTSCCPLAPLELYVGAGQGFFVQMIDGPATTDFVTFNNTLRDGVYDNSFFFKNANLATTATTNIPIDVNNIKRNRIWLDLVNSSNQSSRILVGNIEGATNGRDSLFDANAEISGAFTFYSIIGDAKFFIQGRAMPFNITDEVPLGIKVPTAGNYSIAIAAVDGYFVEKRVFIKDMLLNTVHNLKTAPYQFTSLAGQFDSRFKIVYYNTPVNNKNIDYENSVKVVTNDVIEVQSTKESIDTIVVYDILGRTLGTYTKIDANEFTIRNLIKTNTALLLQIKLQNGIIVNEKVIY